MENRELFSLSRLTYNSHEKVGDFAGPALSVLKAGKVKQFLFLETSYFVLLK